jgi:DNA-binding response OmpR family regulator
MGSSKGIYRILVADDEPMIRRLLAMALGQAGHLVDTCGDGRAALEKLRANAYTILIVDFQMPHKTGLEVIHSLREAGNGLPVVLISSGLTDEAAHEVAEMERVVFLHKPFGLRDLSAAIERVAGTVKL